MGEIINITTTNTGEKRKRLAQACLVCRRKKTKCDGIKPICGNCDRLNQQCSYAPSNRKRGSRQAHIEVLEQRLAKMESLLKNNNNNNNNNNTQNSKLSLAYLKDNNDNNNNGKFDINHIEHYNNNKYKINYGSIPTIESYNASSPASSSSSSSKDMKLLPQVHFGQCLSLDTNHHKVIDMDRNLLPNKEVMNGLIQLYLDRVYGCSPFFYSQDLDYDTTPIVVLMAITAATAKFSPRFIDNERPVWLLGETYAEQIRKRMDEIIDMPSIEHIQTLLLMIMHEFGCARGARCWMYCGIASRMALDLGLQKEPTQRLKPGTVMTLTEWKHFERRRNVFWCLYVFETFGSASCARTVYYKDEDIDTHIPCDDDCLEKDTFYSESLNGTELIKYMVSERNDDGSAKIITYVETINQDPISRSRCAQGWPTHFIRITSLYAEVASFVNRKMVRSNTPLSPYDMGTNEFESINEKLDIWYNQLPLLLRNTPANLQRYRNENSRDLQRFLLSHILYNSLIIFLNRPAFRLVHTVDNLNNIPTHISESIHIGVEKCLAASDNVGIMLTDINMNVKRIFPFLSYLTYTTATVVVHTLFTGTSSEAKKAAESLKTHFQFLQNMRKYYATADKLFFMIRTFFQVNKNQLKTRGIDRTLQIGNETSGKEEEEEGADTESKKEDIDHPSHQQHPSNHHHLDHNHQLHHQQYMSTTKLNDNSNSKDPRYQPIPSPSTSSLSSITTSGSNNHQLTLDELVGSIDSQFNYLLEQQLPSNAHMTNLSNNDNDNNNNNSNYINHYNENLYNLNNNSNNNNLQWQQTSNYYLANGVLPTSTSTEQEIFTDWPFTF